MLATLPTRLRLPEALSRRMLRPTWVEVDLDAIEHNVATVKRFIGDVRLIGVLKGDACGFGAAECALAMEAAGADMVAVGNAFEVPVLRARGVRCPILLYASFVPESVAEIVRLGAIPTIAAADFLQPLAQAARSLPNPLDVFVKIDTGLGRLGVPYEDALALIGAVAKSPALRLLGLYSHCGGADGERASAQLERMQHVLAGTRKLGIDVPFNVLAATPHIIERPDMWLTAVDPGRLLFGITSSDEATCVGGELLPALRGLRSRLIQVKASSSTDPPEYRADGAGGVRRFGVLPFGWTDVLLREPYERTGVLVHGVPARFITALSAEHSVIDLTSVPEARSGDVVTIIGRDGNRAIDIKEMARGSDLQVSDITRRFHRHLPFVYFRDDVPVRLKTPVEEVEAPF